MLKIEKLCKNFEKVEVIKNLDLNIEDGSVFGLVGINGAGKSTLLRCIAGVYNYQNGTILFDDHDTYNEPSIRKDIMYVSDDAYYPTNSTLLSLKDFYNTFYDLDEMLYQKYLKLFGLAENTPISAFSKGMKRQTSLLFALAIKPKLLLLDECFDGLDPLVRLTFKKALVDMIEDENITVIISSHNLKELEDICDSFGILENGKIDTYGDLLESKENIVKFQLAYENEKDKEVFQTLNILNFKKEGRVITLVVKDEIDAAREYLKKTNPLIMDELAINFEELFIYEVESRGMLNE